MTELKFHSKPRWRASGAITRDRGIHAIIVALEPDALLLRLKRRRAVYRLPLSLAYLKAVQLEAARVSAEKIERRKSAKKGKAKR